MSHNESHALQIERSAALFEVARLLNTREEIGAAFEPLVDVIKPHVPFDFASLAVVEADPAMERAVGWYPADALPGPRTYAILPQSHMLAAEFPQGARWRIDEVAGHSTHLMQNYGLRFAWTLPLLHKGALYGEVTFARRFEPDFSREELRFLRGTGLFLAGAAREEHSIWKAERDAARSQLLNELTILLSEGRDPANMFDRVVEMLASGIRFDGAALLRLDSGGRLRPVAIGGDAGSGLAIPLAETPLQDVIARGDRWCELDLAHGESPLVRALSIHEPRLVHVQVLHQRGRLLGAMLIARCEPRPVAPEDAEFLALACTLLGQAIVNHEAVESELRASRAEAEQQRLVTTIARIAAGEHDLSRLMARVRDTLNGVIPNPVLAYAFQSEEEASVLRSEGPALRGERGLLDPLRSLQVPASFVPPDLPPPVAACDWFDGAQVSAVTITAPSGGSGSWGTLLAGSRRPGWRFAESEQRILALAAQFIGSAIQTCDTLDRLDRGHALLELIITSLEDGIVLLDHENKPAFVNEHGRCLLDSFAAVDADALIAPGNDGAIDLGRRGEGDVTLHPGGRPRAYRYQVNPLDHPAYRTLVVLQDVQEQKERTREREEHERSMAQAARLAALGELVGGVAHELNNPLTAILGFAELMAISPDAEPLADELALVQKEALRARNIVRDLLFLVRPGEVEREELRLDSLLGHLERLRRNVWVQQGIDTRVVIEAGDQPLAGNEHQLTQVLLNLVTNAEHALEGIPEPRLDIRARIEDADVVIEVEDNGRGMPAPVVARIWEPFFTTRPGVGTGLGLSLSRTIIQNHDGRIEVDSRPGRGTLVRVVIPRRLSTNVSSVPEPDAAPGPGRVLVVDDEPSLRRLASRLIATLGHDCDVAGGVDDALSLAAAHDYDLILCDYRLAAHVADDIVDGLAERRPALVDRVVIATGATTDPGVTDLASRHGLRILPKPYGMDEVARLMSDYKLGSSAA